LCACPSRLTARWEHAGEDSGGAVWEWPWGRLKDERGDAQGWGISRCDTFDSDNNTSPCASACEAWSKRGCGRSACESPGRRSLAGAAGCRAECLLGRGQQPQHIAARRCAVSMAMQKRRVFTMQRILGRRWRPVGLAVWTSICPSSFHDVNTIGRGRRGFPSGKPCDWGEIPYGCAARPLLMVMCGVLSHSAVVGWIVSRKQAWRRRAGPARLGRIRLAE
jgi:hypothetical protein